MLLTLLAAFAGDDPTVTLTDDGVFISSFITHRPAEHVRPLVGDPVWVAKTDDAGTVVEMHAPDGDCVVATNTTPSSIKTVHYKIRYCETPVGWTGTLLDSNAMSTYDLSWNVTESAAGTKVEYRLSFTSKLMVPRFIINKLTKDHVSHLMGQLQRELSAP